MSRITKRKFAIIFGITECLVYAEAKYCAFEKHGEPRYLVCPNTEQCCNLGCCAPGFQIYHLWYYWLLVIIMFLVCSGGGWWYRYWLQGRYRAAASAIPTRNSVSRTQSSLRGSTYQAQQARISYNPSRNTVLLHRMWKAPHRNLYNCPPPYNGASASSAHYQNTSVVLSDVNCPFYQLYGPPPSYETVIAQTRGKISSPTTPELLRSTTRSASLLPNENFSQCFSHTYNLLPPSQINAIDMSHNFQNGSTDLRIEGFDTNEYVRLLQQCNVSSPPIRQDLCIPICDAQQTFIHSKSLEPSDDVESVVDKNSSPEKFSVPRSDCIGGSCIHHSHLQNLFQNNSIVPQSSIHCPLNQSDYSTPTCSQSLPATEPMATTSTFLNFDNSYYRAHSRHELKIQGGSLKMPRNKDRRDCMKLYNTMRINKKLNLAESSSCYDRIPQSTSDNSKHYAECSVCNLQSNPSSNVILEPSTSFSSSNNIATVESSLPANTSNITNSNARNLESKESNSHQESFLDECSSTNDNRESKRKLDRSKSLE